MKIKIVSGFLVLLFCVCSTFAHAERVSWVKTDNNVYNISGELEAGILFANIVYEKVKITDRWLLQIRKSDGFIIGKSEMISDNHCYDLDEDTYINLLSKVLDFLRKDSLPIDSIHLDLDLVSSSRKDILFSVGQLSTQLDGVVEYKNREIFDVILSSLDSSSQINRTCKLLDSYGLSCKKRKVGMNPIAFRHELIGKDWEVIKNYKMLGIPEGSWFSINIGESK